MAPLCEAGGQASPEGVLPLLDALLAGQEQALSAATAARTEADTELDKLQQTLGRAEQAEKLRLELTAAQARQDALRPVLDAAEAEAARHAGDSSTLDALAGKLERAKADLAAFDGLDSLEKKLSAARDAAALENARAEKRRAALGQLDGELTALEQSLAALGGAEAEKVSLEARAEQLARRETALAQLAQSLAEGQRRGQITRSMPYYEIAHMYALCERAIIYDYCISDGGYALGEYTRKTMPLLFGGVRVKQEVK